MDPFSCFTLSFVCLSVYERVSFFLHIFTHFIHIIFTHLSAQYVTKIVEGKYIQLNQRDLRLYIAIIYEKSPFVHSSVVWFWRNLKHNWLWSKYYLNEIVTKVHYLWLARDVNCWHKPIIGKHSWIICKLKQEYTLNAYRLSRSWLWAKFMLAGFAKILAISTLYDY